MLDFFNLSRDPGVLISNPGSDVSARHSFAMTFPYKLRLTRIESRIVKFFASPSIIILFSVETNLRTEVLILRQLADDRWRNVLVALFDIIKARFRQVFQPDAAEAPARLALVLVYCVPSLASLRGRRGFR